MQIEEREIAKAISIVVIHLDLLKGQWENGMIESCGNVPSSILG